MELGITPSQKGEFSQQFHFYLDVGNVLVIREIGFEGVCIADTPTTSSDPESATTGFAASDLAADDGNPLE